MLLTPIQGHRFIRPIVAILASLAFCLPAAAAPDGSEGQALDQVIAIVDDDVVLASELRERVQQVVTNIEKQGKQAPPMAEIQKSLLDHLILENIQMQLAVRAGFRISDPQLNDSIQRKAQPTPVSQAKFKQSLAADG